MVTTDMMLMAAQDALRERDAYLPAGPLRFAISAAVRQYLAIERPFVVVMAGYVTVYREPDEQDEHGTFDTSAEAAKWITEQDAEPGAYGFRHVPAQISLATEAEVSRMIDMADCDSMEGVAGIWAAGKDGTLQLCHTGELQRDPAWPEESIFYGHSPVRTSDGRIVGYVAHSDH